MYKEIYNNEPSALSLWRESPEKWWNWNYINNPAGLSYPLVAEDNGIIIGHISGRSIYLNIQGTRELTFYCWGLLTHPSYMRMGIGRSLSNYRDEYVVEKGGLVSYGVTTVLGQKTTRPTGRNLLGVFKRYVKVINARSVVKKITGSGALGTIVGIPLGFGSEIISSRYKGVNQNPGDGIIEVTRFDERFDDLWSRIKGNFKASIWRDSEYLNWLYVYPSNLDLKIYAIQEGDSIQGYVVADVIDARYRIGRILDLMSFKDDDSVLRMLQYIVNYLKEAGADFIEFATFDHNPYLRFFKRAGFRQYGESYHLTIKQAAEFNKFDIQDNQNWFLTSGDAQMHPF